MEMRIRAEEMWERAAEAAREQGFEVGSEEHVA